MLASLLLLSATAGPELIAASQTNANEATKGWRISYSVCCGVAGPAAGTFMGVTDAGVVNFSSGFASQAVCYAASDAQVREIKSILAQLNFSVPPKPARKSEPMPDVPSVSLILTYGGHDFDLNQDYPPATARERLIQIVSQLVAEGRKRIVETSSSKTSLAGSVPCPPKTSPQ
jgi:hypothetical protein